MSRGQHGSAMVIALLIAFILSLLGASFLMMAHTESQIAANERLGTQALYAAETGARSVKSWFDGSGAIALPTLSEIDRTERLVIDETDPYDESKAQPAGSGPAYPTYKQGTGEIFAPPFRGGPEDTLLGHEEGPDVRIDAAGGPAAAAFLTQLSLELFGSFPDTDGSQTARIRRIDVFAPPYVQRFGTWTRYGIASVRVVAGIYRTVPGMSELELAQRSVTLVLNEAPYTTPVYGPLHSCGGLALDGPLPAHWGTVTATGDVSLGGALVVPPSIPRAAPPASKVDSLWTSEAAKIDSFNASFDSCPVADPWLRLVVGGDIEGQTPGLVQPFPPVLPPPTCSDNSNVIQSLQAQGKPVNCPAFDLDYDFWKRVATSGEAGGYYYAWAGADDYFSRDGIEPAQTFQQIFDDANGEPGIYFFDTRDGRKPEPDGSNLSDPIQVSGNWRARGFVFVNTSSFTATGLSPSLPVTMNAPGEERLGTPAAHVQLAYPTAANAPFPIGGPPGPALHGPDIPAVASLEGILFVTGTYQASGGGLHYGSVIARGVTLSGSAPFPQYYWDDRLAGSWPPAGWRMPRVVVTRFTAGP